MTLGLFNGVLPLITPDGCRSVNRYKAAILEMVILSRAIYV